MTITSYFGIKRCCDCGRIGSYTVKIDGFQFTTCSDCVNNFFPDEEEEETVNVE